MQRRGGIEKKEGRQRRMGSFRDISVACYWLFLRCDGYIVVLWWHHACRFIKATGGQERLGVSMDRELGWQCSNVRRLPMALYYLDLRATVNTIIRDGPRGEMLKYTRIGSRGQTRC